MRNPRVLAAIMIAAFSFFLLPGTVRADDAQSLLAKHKAFVGWTYGDGQIKTMSVEESYVNDKGEVEETITEKRFGLGYRQDYVSSKNNRGGSAGFTGNLFWRTSMNGFTVPVIGENTKQLLSYRALIMEGTPQLPAVLQGQGNVNGKSVPIVRVTMGGANAMDLYVDPDSGAYLRVVIDPNGTNETTMNILSYMTTDQGKKIIGSWSYGDDRGHYSLSKVVANANVDVADLHPPAASATWTFANPNPFPIKANQDRVYVNATVNGVPGRFILDTGAAHIVLTDEFANRANVKTVDRSKAYGIGGVATSLIRKADTIVLGGNTLSDVYVSTINEKFNDKAYGEKLDGLMGFDLFGGAVINLNLSAQTMSIGNPATTTVDPNIGYRVAPDLTTLQPRVSVKIAGKVDATAILDSGGYQVVIVSKEIEKHGILLVADRERTFLGGNRVIAGVGGTSMALCGLMSGIDVGPIRYGDINACESADWPLHSALIGFDFMKNFDFVFDYPHGQMFMTPHKN